MRNPALALTLFVHAVAVYPVLAAVDIDALIAGMTLDEKIGQMTMAERSSASPDDVRNFFLGSILSGGGSAPDDNSPTGWADMHDAFQNAALQTRLQIPIVYGIDAVHGHNNVFGATIFPHNIGLGATRDPNLIEEIGRITALEVAATGLEWDFAPCVAVARDERWGRTYESFGEDPNLQVLLAGRYVLGLQGMTMNGQHVIGCAKHYIGDGGTNGGVDRGNTILDETTLRSIHLPGFLAALDQNVGTVMPSYSSWNGVKMHEQSYLLTDVLKGELGFDGFVISDWEAVYELSGASYYDQVVQMVNAGVDMGMEPYNWQNWINTLKSAALNGDVSISRIDDAVRRILLIKDRAGVFDQPLADRSLVNGGHIGHLSHRNVAREAVRKSLVLLKNDGVLPLARNLNVFVAGKNADNIGHQCGGWTIDWQGGSGSITPGTTILEGIQAQVTSGGGNVTFSEDGTGSAGHDVAIVVIGETPYAEGYGDDTSLTLDALDMACLSRIADIPTVVVLVSGRAMMISDHINDLDAFVAAWLPGTEGDGIAEVLFGDEDFTGKLPVSWPLNITQVPINLGDVSYNPLFPYGFGLDYSSQPPNVTLTSPLDGATIPVGNILISATAADPNGTIVAVEFYEGANFIAADMNAPYQITWPAVADGCYTLLAKAIDNDGLSGTDSIDITVGTGCDGQVPFFGSPMTIPGIIQAEHYDLGGASVAYLDADASNNGGAYRTEEGVDLEACSDSGGGYNVGWMSGGEWIEYSVDVTIPGEYRIDSRVASQDTGGSFHLEILGQNLTGAILVPVTGGWQTWTTVSTPVDLSAGRQIIRFANSSSSDEYNLNYLEFVLLHPLGDIDRDGDVDSDDFDAGSLCLAGPGISISQPCTFADHEQDNDVDIADFAISQHESVGPVP